MRGFKFSFLASRTDENLSNVYYGHIRTYCRSNCSQFWYEYNIILRLLPASMSCATIYIHYYFMYPHCTLYEYLRWVATKIPILMLATLHSFGFHRSFLSSQISSNFHTIQFENSSLLSELAPVYGALRFIQDPRTVSFSSSQCLFYESSIILILI